MYIIVTYLVKEKDLYCYIGKNNLELTPIIKLNFKIDGTITWGQPKCPSADGWVRKMWRVHGLPGRC